MIKKGGSDPLSLFGPQAGRKEGVAPALLPYSPACLFRAPKLVKFCLIEGLKNYERKTVRKPVRKTEFRTVFHSGSSCLTRLFGFQRLGGGGRG